MFSIYECCSLDEQNELLEKKRKVGYSVLALNESFEYIEHRYIVDFPECKVSLGINTHSLGIDSKKIYYKKRRILLGYDFTILWLITNPVLEIIKKYNTTSYFFEFIPLENTDDVIFISEIDVARVSIYGNIGWNIGFSDVITDFKIKENILCLNFFEDDSETIKVDLVTGDNV